MKFSVVISVILFMMGLSASAEPLNYKCAATIKNDSNLSVFKIQLEQNKILLFLNANGEALMGDRVTTDQDSDLSKFILFSIETPGEIPYKTLEIYLEPDFLNRNADSEDRLFSMVQKSSHNDIRQNYLCVRK